LFLGGGFVIFVCLLVAVVAAFRKAGKVAKFAVGGVETRLRPGKSYLTTFVFDVPADARNPRLLITDVDLVTRLLVDHENSPLHDLQ